MLLEKIRLFFNGAKIIQTLQKKLKQILMTQKLKIYRITEGFQIDQYIFNLAKKFIYELLKYICSQKSIFRMTTKQYSLFNSFLKKRLIAFGIITIFFIIGFVANSAFFQSAFNYSGQIVSSWQDDPDINNETFLGFMNFISDYLFYPGNYQYYAMVFLVFSHRKLQVGIFYIWLSFIFFLCESLKAIYHYPRPFYADQGVQMLAKSCLYDYGMPSEHAIAGIVFLQFFVRFYLRQYNFFWKTSYIWYIIAILLQILICFSRMILGAHSLNQVLFGFMIGIFLCIMYVNFIENLLMRACLAVMRSERKIINGIIIGAIFLLSLIVEILYTFVPQYNNQQYIININNIPACAPVIIYNSFQYNGFAGCGYAAGAFGILFAFLIINHPQNLILKPLYSYISLQYLKRTIIGLLIGGVSMWVFMNGFWDDVQNFNNPGLPAMEWVLLSLGPFLGPFLYLCITPIIGEKLGLQIYQYPQSYALYKEKEIFTMEKQKFKQSGQQVELSGYQYHTESQGQVQ